MSVDPIILKLEEEWDLEKGFFGHLRRGRFDTASFRNLTNVLDSINFHNDEAVKRRLVSLVWYMPLFMEWQKERIQKNGGNLIEFEKAVNHVQNSVERILGIP